MPTKIYKRGKYSGFPTDTEIMTRITNLNLDYPDKNYIAKVWKELYQFATSAGVGTSREGTDVLQVFGDSTDVNVKFLDQIDFDGEPYFQELKEIYGDKITGDEVYLFIVQKKSDMGDIERIRATDKFGRGCITKCAMVSGKCVCTLEDTMEYSECNPRECGLSESRLAWVGNMFKRSS